MKVLALPSKLNEMLQADKDSVMQALLMVCAGISSAAMQNGQRPVMLSSLAKIILRHSKFALTQESGMVPGTCGVCRCGDCKRRNANAGLQFRNAPAVRPLLDHA